MHPFTLARLEQRVQQFGQIACVPHATYHRDRQFHPAFEALLRKLYTHPIRPTIMAVYEDVRLQHLAEKLSEQEKRLIKRKYQSRLLFVVPPREDVRGPANLKRVQPLNRRRADK